MTKLGTEAPSPELKKVKGEGKNYAGILLKLSSCYISCKIRIHKSVPLKVAVIAIAARYNLAILLEIVS